MRPSVTLEKSGGTSNGVALFFVNRRCGFSLAPHAADGAACTSRFGELGKASISHGDTLHPYRSQ
jgi:hypothetical protein